VERIRKLLSESAAGHAGVRETGALIIELTGKMHEAAARLQFERAAEFRNAIRAVEELSLPISVNDGDPGARDYIAWASEGICSAFAVLSMRGGRMTGKDVFSALSAAEEGESMETFITVYYGPGRPPPPVIFLGSGRTDQEEAPAEIPDPAGLGRWFREQFGHEPALSFSGEKHHGAILAMARQNALEELRRRLRERGAGPGLDELVRALGLRTRPERIEGFDIAQLDGKHPVASLISYKNGVPDRKNYRYFKLRTVVGVVDDFAAMREAVRRRYSRLIREGKELPDLVLIDGGIGQVNAARGVMDELGIHCGMVGLAKREEELWLPEAKAPVILPRRSEALKILQFVRDETHRFATRLNQRLRSGDLSFSALESVEGIGPRRAAAIMNVYGSVEGIAAADPVELAERCGIGRAAARAVRAAAKLALEDRQPVRVRSAAGGRAGSGESLAAEAAPEYDSGGEEPPG
jgi:excinuclease ABC subunit C